MNKFSRQDNESKSAPQPPEGGVAQDYSNCVLVEFSEGPVRSRRVNHRLLRLAQMYVRLNAICYLIG